MTEPLLTGVSRRAFLIDSSKPAGAELRSVEVLLNPAEFRIKASSEYSRLQVPGLSHEVIQWSHSMSLEYSFGVDWSYQIASERRRGRSAVDANFYQWLLSFIFPIEPGRAPPLMQIFWPGFLWIAGDVLSVEPTISRWSMEGVPMDYRCEVNFLEHRRTFLTSENAFNGGFDNPDLPGVDNGMVGFGRTGEFG